jgi:hypothetical protein
VKVIEKAILFISLASLLIPQQVRADIPYAPHTFKVAVVCGDGVDCGQGLASIKNANDYLHSRLNVTLQIVRVVRSGEMMSGGFFERMVKWRLRAAELRVDGGVDVTLFLSAPFPGGVPYFDFNEESIIGMASDIGVLGKAPCFAFVKVMGSEQFSTRVLTHEVGHLLGAHHVDTGLMHPSAAVNQYSNEFSLESIHEILEHLASL